MSVLYGIDVSEHNGVINWEKVKASGKVQFAMLRAGYGQTAVDKQFRRNAAECNRVGIPIGIYWFSYASSTDAVQREANACLETICDYTITYPVAFDWEDDSVRVCKSVGVTPTKSLATSLAKVFLKTIESHDYIPALYTNPAYLNQYFDKASLLDYFSGELDIWLAQWPYTPNPAVRHSMNPEIWQYSEKGKIPGIATDVDLNACYVKYEEEDDLATPITMERLTGDLKLANQKQWFEKPEDDGMSMLDLAKKLGFTDGSKPYEIPSRAEVMTMITRAYVLLRSDIDAKLETIIQMIAKVQDDRK